MVVSIFNYIKWSPILTKFVYNIFYSRVAAKERQANFEETEKLKKLKDVHKGDRCFIIGTGPSLKIADLEVLKNEYTFAPNRIYELLDKTDWFPTYYMCQDYKIIKTFADKIKTVKSKLSFLPVNSKNEFNDNKYCFFVLKEQLFYPDNAPFSKEVSRFIGQGYTVTYGAIQMAIYMGFSEIFLLGIDHNYNIIRDSKGRPVKVESGSDNYSKDMGNYMDIKNLPRIEESTIAYETAEKISHRMGVRIYNATRGGKLAAFERVDFDSIKKK